MDNVEEMIENSRILLKTTQNKSDQDEPIDDIDDPVSERIIVEEVEDPRDNYVEEGIADNVNNLGNPSVERILEESEDSNVDQTTRKRGQSFDKNETSENHKKRKK